MNLFQFGWLGCLAQPYFHIYFNKQCRVGLRKRMLGVHTHCISAPQRCSSWGRCKRHVNRSTLLFKKRIRAVGQDGIPGSRRWASSSWFIFEKMWAMCQKQLILGFHPSKASVPGVLKPLTPWFLWQWTAMNFGCRLSIRCLGPREGVGRGVCGDCRLLWWGAMPAGSSWQMVSQARLADVQATWLPEIFFPANFFAIYWESGSGLHLSHLNVFGWVFSRDLSRGSGTKTSEICWELRHWHCAECQTGPRTIINLTITAKEETCIPCLDSTKML